MLRTSDWLWGGDKSFCFLLSNPSKYNRNERQNDRKHLSSNSSVNAYYLFYDKKLSIKVKGSPIYTIYFSNNFVMK